ncbi:MAG: T9SS type A sorting domain-containing protein, partial [Ignavibacteria bacterium]|nr:T9SS type A sorting domain-containing protein [Ignavibacteria bacterium]
LNGVPRKFVFNGDPETNTGWLMNFQFDVRFSMSTGPLYLANNQSTSITIVIIAARGTSNLNSVTRLKQIAASLPIPVININNEIPDKFILYQNYPNPFNPTTNIIFDIPKQSYSKLIVYDILGREIALLVNKELGVGSYKVSFNGSSYPSGVYFYKLQADEFTDIKKMLLIK